jgi:arylsulfatase A-like enzyme
MDVTSTMYPGLIDELVEAYGPAGHDHVDVDRISGRPASTPTLDALARGGIAFTNVWAHPFCSPTRAAILTGLFGAKTNVLTYADPLDQNHSSFVTRLRDEGGYSTGLFGKWHLAGLPGENVSYPGMKPKEAGFDIFKGNFHAAITTFWEYDYEEQNASTAPSDWTTTAPPERTLAGIGPTTFAPVVKAADTLDWVAEREAEDPGKPWFAWLAFNLSHATIAREPSQMAVPDADALDAVSLAEMQACGGEFGTQELGNCSGEAVMRAMTNALDTVVGHVIDGVLDLDPNTYVIYIGDNGTPMYGRPGLDFIDNMYITRSGRGKGTSYESGARVPLTVTGPGIEAGTRSDEYAHAADMFATILELAGLEVPELVAGSEGSGDVRVDAKSLMPIILDAAAWVRDPNDDFILSESSNLMTGGTNQVGARNARFKLICTGSAAAEDCEFYDLANDPLEEYALPKPAACAAYEGGTLNPAEQDWHFCRLQEVVAEHSFLQ